MGFFHSFLSPSFSVTQFFSTVCTGTLYTTLCHCERNAPLVAAPLATGSRHASAGYALGPSVHHGLRGGGPGRVRIRQQSALSDPRHHARDVYGFRIHQPPVFVWPRTRSEERRVGQGG